MRGLKLVFARSLRRRCAFNDTTLAILKRLIDSGPVGNRWFKVNLHVHGQGNDPTQIVRQARAAELDLIAVTDHQSFDCCDPVTQAAQTTGRPLTVLPGIEITAHEGVHVLAVFPAGYSGEQRTRLLGWLEIIGGGDTRVACKKNLADIFDKVEKEGGVIVVPHPYTDDIGLLATARKISTKTDWLETGYVRLIQVAEDKVTYVARDQDGNWINRYVLNTASPEQIRSSTYCLAPFNRSDAHKSEEIADGCSWFRISEPTVEGLKQVACEPRTRISRTPPSSQEVSAILGMRIFGGHCDGEAFRFNHALNCIVGQNYAGKSAVFDFIRIALGLEDDVPQDLRDRLLLRLYAILGSGGKIELYLRHERAYYVVGRAFNPQVAGEGTNLKVLDLPDALACYRYDVDQDALVPVDQFTFPIEVYEQGRIHRLRDDVGRQLEMLDEFAHVGELKKEREGILTKLSENAQTLAPLSAERDQLNADVANLAAYKLELAEKEKLLPGEVEQHWAKTESVVNEVKEIISTLQTNIGQLRNSVIAKAEAFPTDFDTIFAHSVPECRTEEVVEVELVAKLVGHVRVALSEIERGRSTVVQAVQNLEADTKSLLDAWQEQRKSHVEAVRTQLRQAGVESPQEVINRVAELRRNVKSIETVKQPRLVKVNELIDLHGKARECLIGRLEDLGREITKKRQDKAKELTSALGGQIKISVTPHADTSEYLRVLNELCEEISTAQSRIQKRDEQLKRVATTVSPLQLARALARKGVVRLEDGSETTLRDLCGVTENTQTVLCRIADNIVHLNTLESVTVPDVPEILVQRRGETAYADLRTGLSQGEQSAAILTLALQTRAMPLILDQPEDELGYNYVVHLVVPKILQAKFSRQLLVVTHNANIPVLGDADYVIKMENRPRPEGGRTCVVATEGCFESNAVTRALIELEGGERAFQFRQHRYEIPITK